MTNEKQFKLERKLTALFMLKQRNENTCDRQQPKTTTEIHENDLGKPHKWNVVKLNMFMRAKSSS